MNKRIVGIISIMLVVLMAFTVSCDAGQNAERTGNVRMATSDEVTRSLTVADPSFNADELYWKYASRKVDSLEFHTGQTETYDAAGAKSVSKTGQTGLKDSVGPFSMGKWDFLLFAYTDVECTKLAWQGETKGTDIKAGITNTITVKVGALQTEAGTGTLEIGDILLKDGTPAKDALDRQNLTLIVKYIKVGAEGTINEVESYYPDFTEKIENIPSGAYWVTVQYVDADDYEIIRGEEKKLVNIFDNVTSRVGGYLSENTEYVEFESTGDIRKDSSADVVVSSDQATSMTAPVTPEGVPSGNSTTVEIATGGLNPAAGKAKIDVVVYTANAADALFTVTDGSAAVAGLDLSLSQADSGKVSSFNGQSATVSTFIKKGLNPALLDVKYSGEGEAPVFSKADLSVDTGSETGYNPTTGELRFKTNHFSSFYVTSSEILAVNSVTGEIYTKLNDALKASKPEESIKLLRNVDVEAKIQLRSISGCVLDLNGNILSLKENGYIDVFDTEITITDSVGSGKIESINAVKPIFRTCGSTIAVEGGTYVSASPVFGQYTTTMLKNMDIVIKGGSFESTRPGMEIISSVDRTGILNLNISGGKFKNVSGPAILTNGANTKANSIVITGNPEFECMLAYFPSNGTFRVEGGTFTNESTVLYVKGGKLEITGGTFTTTSTEDLPWAHCGNGAVSNGSAVIVEGSDTYSNVSVAITGGTFNAAQNSNPEHINHGLLVIDWRSAEDKAPQKPVDRSGITVDYAYSSPSGHSIANVGDTPADGLFWFDDTNSGILNASSIWDGTSDAEWGAVSATTYTIANAREFARFRDLVNEGTSFEGATVTLMNDIDLGWKSWTPIGDVLRKGGSKHWFNGTFDGNGHRIYGLNVVQAEAADDMCYGLFGCVDPCTIRNLSVASGLVEAKFDAAGGIVGAFIPSTAADTILIENCSNHAYVKSSTPLESEAGAAAGGILARGKAFGTTVIRNCSNYGSVVSVNGKAGGILAQSYSGGKATIDGCHNYADITSSYIGAGILGYAGDGREGHEVIVDSVNHGNVTVTGAYNSTIGTGDRYAGHIVAFRESPGKITLTNCSSEPGKTVTIAVCKPAGFLDAAASADCIILENDITVDALPEGFDMSKVEEGSFKLTVGTP